MTHRHIRVRSSDHKATCACTYSPLDVGVWEVALHRSEGHSAGELRLLHPLTHNGLWMSGVEGTGT